MKVLYLLPAGESAVSPSSMGLVTGEVLQLLCKLLLHAEGPPVGSLPADAAQQASEAIKQQVGHVQGR